MELIASGREADVYALDEHRVLRRLRHDVTIDWEADLAAHLRRHDYPLPAVLEHDGKDTVYERVDGPTMLDDVGRRPWRLTAHARTLADLHRRLHAVPAPDYLPAIGAPGQAIIHRDLHPQNVIMGEAGPCVIDWTHAARGRGPLDVALSWVIMATAELPSGGLDRVIQAAGRRLFVARFLRGAGRGAARDALDEAAGMRLVDPRVTETERRAIAELVRRER